MNTLLGMLDQWIGQEVARTNAAQACVRLQHDRRQRTDVETWLQQHPGADLLAHTTANPREFRRGVDSPGR